MDPATVRTRLVVIALAIASWAASLPASATDETEAPVLVARSLDTIQTLAGDPEFVAMKAALARAKAVLILPQVVKVGFVLGGSGGSGVLLAREDGKGAWVGPAFHTMGSASLGLQAGASSAEMVMVINSQKALDSLYTNKLKLGAEASAALGARGQDKGAALGADFVVYAKVKGAFAGVAVDVSVPDVRQTLNNAYYRQGATPVEILVKRSVSSSDAAGLRAAVAEASR